jgi:hypothetical protein
MQQSLKSTWFLVLGMAVASTLGCNSSGGGSGGGVAIQPTQDGAFAGFLWKPRSESNGNLVVLLPNALRGQVVSGAIHSDDSRSAATMIEAGVFAGDDHNGARPHYRFSQSGAAYGADVWFIAETADGQALAYNIPNGASRWD